MRKGLIVEVERYYYELKLDDEVFDYGADCQDSEDDHLFCNFSLDFILEYKKTKKKFDNMQKHLAMYELERKKRNEK